MQSTGSFIPLESPTILHGWCVDDVGIFEDRAGVFQCLPSALQSSDVHMSLFAPTRLGAEVSLVAISIGGELCLSVDAVDSPFLARFMCPTGCIGSIEGHSMTVWSSRANIVVDIDSSLTCSLLTGESVPPSMRALRCNFDITDSTAAILDCNELIAPTRHAEAASIAHLLAHHPISAGLRGEVPLPRIGPDLSRLMNLLAVGSRAIVIGGCIWSEICTALDSAVMVWHICSPSKIRDALCLHRMRKGLGYVHLDLADLSEAAIWNALSVVPASADIVIDHTTRQALAVLQWDDRLLRMLAIKHTSVRVVEFKSKPKHIPSVGNYIIERGMKGRLTIALRGTGSRTYREYIDDSHYKQHWLHSLDCQLNWTVLGHNSTARIIGCVVATPGQPADQSA
eukprot:4434773-Heterocapsa_arctica.AAC.1